MSKGGDQTTTASTSDYNSTIKPYVTDALAKAQTVANQPYTQYQGQRLADFSPDTQNAFQDIRTQVANGGGTPAVDQGIAAAGNAANFTANQFPGTDLSQYMSPYYKQVVDYQKQQANQDFQEQQASRDAAAVQAGAFGGDRRFVSDSLAQRDLNNQLQGIEATGAQNAFTAGTNLWSQDQTNRYNAAGLGLNAASALGQLGQTKNDLGLNNAQALSSVGSKIQQQQQAGLDLAKSDFEAQRDWPAKQLQLYSQLINGQQVTPSTTTTTTAPAPDFLSQLAGLATGGVGLAKLLGLGG